jgi:hypothetical protein
MKKWIIGSLIFLMANVNLFAAGKWSIEQSYSRGETSIHVIGVEGYKMIVKASNLSKEDEIPGKIQLGNTSQYIRLTIVAPNGDKWSKRLYIKKWNELKVKFKHKAKVKIAESNVPFYNIMPKCGGINKYSRVLFAVFKNPGDKNPLMNVTVPYNKTPKNVKLAHGVYYLQFWVSTWGKYTKKWSAYKPQKLKGKGVFQNKMRYTIPQTKFFQWGCR